MALRIRLGVSGVSLISTPSGRSASLIALAIIPGLLVSADFTDYNDGERGGKVKVRAKIEERSKYLLAITELPYGVTTESLIESILLPETVMVPPDGRSRPAMRFKSVDLPEPDGPISAS